MKKWLCLLLAACLLVPLASCANTGDSSIPPESLSTQESQTFLESSDAKDTQSPPPESADTSAVTEEPDDSDVLPHVDRKNYNKTFCMVGMNEPGSWYYAKEYIEGDKNVHILNNTVYEMNTLVEDYLGVNLTYKHVDNIRTGGEVYDTVRPALISGLDEYQLCILHPYYSYNSFISNGQALDFYTLGSLDLERDYWNAAVMDQLSINGRAYIGLGDLCQYNLDILYCNKELLADAGRAVPYDKVRNKNWTIDELLTLTTGLFGSNGDDKHDNKDTYGFAAMWDANASAFMQASGIYVLTRNEENTYELSLYSERLVNLYDKLLRLAKDESTYLWTFGNANNPDYKIDFRNKQVYVTLDALGTQYLDADFDVGMLPLPKYDVAQEQYGHPNWGNNIIVPRTVKNTDMVGDVLEMMAYYSQTHVQKVYYDNVLQLRVSDAPDDREMVELIYNTVVFDPGIAYCDGYQPLWDLVYLPTFSILNKEASIESRYRKAEKQMERGKTLQKIFDIKEYD